MGDRWSELASSPAGRPDCCSSGLFCRTAGGLRRPADRVRTRAARPNHWRGFRSTATTVAKSFLVASHRVVRAGEGAIMGGVAKYSLRFARTGLLALAHAAGRAERSDRGVLACMHAGCPGVGRPLLYCYSLHFFRMASVR
jgi:hypothetical protein